MNPKSTPSSLAGILIYLIFLFVLPNTNLKANSSFPKNDSAESDNEKATNSGDSFFMLSVTAVEDKPVSCIGESSGIATATGSAGTPPYTYVWDNGETTASASNLSGGTHTVTVTDAVNATATTSVLVDELLELNGNTTQLQSVSCAGGSDGIAISLITGGTLPYFFAWSNGATVSNPTGLSAGVYTLFVTDSEGCTSSQSALIKEPPPIVLTANAISNANCNGSSDGIGTINASGGNPPYSYNWDTGTTTNLATNLNAGPHTVTVTDANGCFDTASITITEPTILTLSTATIRDVSCNGAIDGSASATAGGGSPAYSYAWDNGETNSMATLLNAGIHIVTVTDQNMCTQTAAANIADAPALSLTAAQDTPVNCFGDATGVATLTPSGGSPAYTFLWDNGATSQTTSNLDGGLHDATVVDAGGCSATVSVFIEELLELNGNVAQASPVSCAGGSDGVAISLITGGTLPYSFAWSSGATVANPNNLAAGVYTLFVTDLVGCTSTQSVTITEPSAISLTAMLINNVSCNDGNDGSASVSATGGTPNIPPPGYNYLWDNGEITAIAVALNAGMHTVSVTDDNGCLETATVTVTEPPLLGAAINLVNNVSCGSTNDGSATALGTGGTPTYTYEWDNGETDATATALTAGNHFATITDANGCTTTASITIMGSPVFSASATADAPVDCFGDATGVATAMGSGGTMIYTYLWDNGATTQTTSNLTGGFHSVTVSDTGGCEATAIVEVLELLELNGSVAQASPVSCAGGSDGLAISNITGGTLPYSFTWSSGATVQNPNNLAAGVYTLSVTDLRGCTSSQSVTITEPPAISLTTMVLSTVSCNGDSDGSASVSATGGTPNTPLPGYSYLWDNGEITATAIALNAGTHSVSVTDANGCLEVATITISEPTLLGATIDLENNVSCGSTNDGSATALATGGTIAYSYEWDNGEISATATGLTAGTHTITVTDANNCTTTASIVIMGAPIFSASATADAPVDCFGDATGVATAMGSGGTMIYTYLWDNGATTQTTSNLTGGFHTVTVSDSDGCSAVAIVEVLELLELNGSVAQASPVSCAGGSDGLAISNITGGTLPYSFAWSSGATVQNPNNLAAGVYTLFVTDLRGCTSSQSVTITEPPAISLTTLALNAVSCNGGNDGSASVSATGGTPGYTFQWDNGEMAATAIALNAGTHSVSVTDDNGCLEIATVVITELPGLSGTITLISNVSCSSISDGSAMAVVSGGTMPYTYAWDNGEISATAISLTAGNHIVTITDANTCIATASILIMGAPAFSASTIADLPVACFGESTGVATANGSGGTPPYTYVWDNSATDQTVSNLAGGFHTVTVSDTDGCQATAEVEVLELLPLNGNVAQTSPVSCSGASDGAAISIITGGTLPYTFIWSTGATVSNPTNLPGGMHTLFVTDLNGCTASASVTIMEMPTLTLFAGVSDNLDCFGDTNGSATAIVNGGNPAYIYQWDNGETTATAINLNGGMHSITVTDQSGCFQTASVSISEPLILTVSINTAIDANCNGQSDGSAIVDASGGTPAYSYIWDNGELTATATGLGAGAHTVTVTDANNCTATTSITIGEPTSIATVSTSSTPILCFGESTGTATVMASGGTPGYTYLWDNGETTSTASNLSAGFHNVTVFDSENCTSVSTVEVLEILELNGNAAQSSPVSCSGGSDGVAISIITGGTLPYSFSWSTGSTVSNPNDLPAGIHTLFITDLNGCTASTSVIISEPTPISVSTTINSNVSCIGISNGSASASVSGGIPGYTYLWGNGEMTSTATNLGVGINFLTITDANGCTETGSVSLLISSNLAIDVINTTNGSCGLFNGLIDIDVIGGTPVFQYSIDNGVTFQNSSVFNNLGTGTYDIVVMDAIGCSVSGQTMLSNSTAAVINQVITSDPTTCLGTDGSIEIISSGGALPMEFSINNGMTYLPTNIFNGLSANTYNVVIQDALGCFDTTIVVLSDPPTPIIDSIDVVDPVCGQEDGSITINVSGGNPNFEYSIDGGISYQSMNAFDSLPPGNYTVTVLDFVGCQTTPISITLFDNGAPNVDNVFVSNTSCGETNGVITINASGGTAPYQYSIDGGLTYQAPTTFTNLPTGTYDVFVMDDAGCTGSDQVVLADDGDIQIDNVATQNPSSCGSSDGSINITVSGGTPIYQYSIDNGMSYQTNGLYTGLSANTYNLVVTDANGCTKTQIVVLDLIPPPMVDNITVVNPSCGLSNGSAEIFVSGGTPNFDYSIDGGVTFQGSNVFNGLMSGTYNVVVEDANNCTTTSTFVLTDFGAPMLDNVVITQPNCGDPVGSIEFLVSGGQSPYMFSIDNGGTFSASNFFPNLGPGTYSYIIEDAAGCQLTGQIILTGLGGLVVNNTTTAPTCNSNDGTINLQATGGTPPYQYSIDNGMTFQTNNQFTGLPAGLYNIVVEDGGGCIHTETINLIDLGSPQVSSIDIQNADCGQPDGSFVIMTTGGTAPLQYSIDNGVTFSGSNTFSNLVPGDYDIVVTDSNGCMGTSLATITSSPMAVVNILTNGPTDLCGGESVLLNAGIFDSYQWSTGETTQIIEATMTGNYEVTIVDANGCSAQDSISVTVAPTIPLDVVEIGEIEIGQLDTISVLFPDPNIIYTWEGSDGTTYTGPSFEFVGATEGTYVFVVTAQVGDCFVTDTLTFEVVDNSAWGIPNAFTPNNDGLNDTFEPLLSSALKIVEFRVYNRWGEKVHDDPATGWDGNFRGKEQTIGLYIYTVIIENLEGKQESKAGEVHLLR